MNYFVKAEIGKADAFDSNHFIFGVQIYGHVHPSMGLTCYGPYHLCFFKPHIGGPRFEIDLNCRRSFAPHKKRVIFRHLRHSW